MTANVVRFPWRPTRLAQSDSRVAAETALRVPPAERHGRASELQLEEPELLLAVCEQLRSSLETSPITVREDAEFFYLFIEGLDRRVGIHDENDYFLGEFALTAGTASRFLFKVQEAKRWFQRAETSFSLVQNGNSHWARGSYQRLALALEERSLEEVLELAPRWSKVFRQLGMIHDALKCRFLEGIAYWEQGAVEKAIEVHRQICSEAETLPDTRLVAVAASNLVRYLAESGQADTALEYAQKALPLLQDLGNRVQLVKLQWSTGDLFKSKGRKVAALEAYRQALTEGSELGMRGDVAALHLVIADLLLEAGQEAQAEWEIRAALPIIDEEKMVPEGIAALSLLRESLRRRQIDKQALRELHGYFQEK